MVDNRIMVTREDLVVKIDLYRLGEQVTTPNDESDSSLGIMLVMHREYAYSSPIVRV